MELNVGTVVAGIRKEYKDAGELVRKRHEFYSEFSDRVAEAQRRSGATRLNIARVVFAIMMGICIYVYCFTLGYSQEVKLVLNRYAANTTVGLERDAMLGAVAKVNVIMFAIAAAIGCTVVCLLFTIASSSDQNMHNAAYSTYDYHLRGLMRIGTECEVNSRTVGAFAEDLRPFRVSSCLNNINGETNALKELLRRNGIDVASPNAHKSV